MNTARNRKSVKRYDIKKEIKGVEKLFSDARKDKTLPSFAEHVMLCIVLGTSEKVNLKKMYPAIHKKFSSWLGTHSVNLIQGK